MKDTLRKLINYRVYTSDNTSNTNTRPWYVITKLYMPACKNQLLNNIYILLITKDWWRGVEWETFHESRDLFKIGKRKCWVRNSILTYFQNIRLWLWQAKRWSKKINTSSLKKKIYNVVKQIETNNKDNLCSYSIVVLLIMYV